MPIALKRRSMPVAFGLVIFTLFAPLAPAQETIKIDGSSTVYPISEAAAVAFKAKNPKINVTVVESGTGSGMQRFGRGEIDIADASRPIKASEMEECVKGKIQFVEIPIAFDALTVVVNPKNTWVHELTIPDLKKIWEPAAKGTITRWNQVRAEWPDTELKLYGPGTASGTFEYFTEAVNGKSKESRSDFTPSEDDNVLVQGVAGDAGALGYFGYSYYAAHKEKLRAVPIVHPKTNKAVSPSVESVKEGTYVPFARPIFIYVNRKSLDRPEVRRFVLFYVENATELVTKAKYIPLPADSYQSILQRVKSGQTGTAFGGQSATGLRIDELFSRPLVNELPPKTGAAPEVKPAPPEKK